MTHRSTKLLTAVTAMTAIVIAASCSRATPDHSEVKEETRDLIRQVYALTASIDRRVGDMQLSDEQLRDAISGLESIRDGLVEDRPAFDECMTNACARMGALDCDDLNEIAAVRSACSNVDVPCLDATCSRLGGLDCDDLDEIQSVGAICQRRTVNSSCVDFSCGQMGRLDCDDLDELDSVHNMCSRNVSTSCMTATCERLGALECDDLDELQSVANLCD
jgi:hypothetical protein